MAQGLTPRQAAFLRHYLESGDAAKAAQLAGYKGDPAVAARRLLAGKRLAGALAEAASAGIAAGSLPSQAARPAAPQAQAAPEPGQQIKQGDVVAGLWSEACFTGKGASHSARVSAWEKLGKHLGMFKEAKANTVPEEIIIHWQEES